MVEATCRPQMPGLDSWEAPHPEPNLETRLLQLELRAALLEAKLEERVAEAKAEIWMDLMKGPWIISVGLAVVVWLRIAAGLVS
ncbi:MAG: hypothetical protein IIB90_18270 [Gemmatimonadetes bacterium]|nr:hypothetical protein [Gemmatimonadota bacterium]MCH8937659.1 hypothetical protein [Gemmatimonadota bacterium]